MFSPEQANNQNEVSMQEAEAFIRGIMEEVAVMGANDSELPDLERLIAGMKERKYRPKEAMEKAVFIRDRKQDYH